MSANTPGNSRRFSETAEAGTSEGTARASHDTIDISADSAADPDELERSDEIDDLDLIEGILLEKGTSPPAAKPSLEEESESLHPTTIVEPSESEEEPREELSEEGGDEPLIPSTVDLNDENLSYKETSAAAYNSFWKYKKFPKGPKVRQTYEIDVSTPNDPHKPIVFNDPVFDKSQKNTVRHFGKARIGEGNDITPNPEKLAQLGKDIEYINERMTGLGDTSAERKEKMKLSSRICRMKRSANHEANKIKFAGLEKEREELCKVIREMRSAMSSSQGASTLKISEEIYRTRVAGRTSEYVNTVLEETESRGTDEYSLTDSD